MVTPKYKQYKKVSPIFFFDKNLNDHYKITYDYNDYNEKIESDDICMERLFQSIDVYNITLTDYYALYKFKVFFSNLKNDIEFKDDNVILERSIKYIVKIYEYYKKTTIQIEKDRNYKFLNYLIIAFFAYGNFLNIQNSDLNNKSSIDFLLNNDETEINRLYRQYKAEYITVDPNTGKIEPIIKSLMFLNGYDINEMQQLEYTSVKISKTNNKIIFLIYKQLLIFYIQFAFSGKYEALIEYIFIDKNVSILSDMTCLLTQVFMTPKGLTRNVTIGFLFKLKLHNTEDLIDKIETIIENIENTNNKNEYCYKLLKYLIHLFIIITFYTEDKKSVKENNNKNNFFKSLNKVADYFYNKAQLSHLTNYVSNNGELSHKNIIDRIREIICAGMLYTLKDLEKLFKIITYIIQKITINDQFLFNHIANRKNINVNLYDSYSKIESKSICIYNKNIKGETNKNILNKDNEIRNKIYALGLYQENFRSSFIFLENIILKYEHERALNGPIKDEKIETDIKLCYLLFLTVYIKKLNELTNKLNEREIVNESLDERKKRISTEKENYENRRNLLLNEIKENIKDELKLLIIEEQYINYDFQTMFEDLVNKNLNIKKICDFNIDLVEFKKLENDYKFFITGNFDFETSASKIDYTYIFSSYNQLNYFNSYNKDNKFANNYIYRENEYYVLSYTEKKLQLNYMIGMMWIYYDIIEEQLLESHKQQNLIDEHKNIFRSFVADLFFDKKENDFQNKINSDDFPIVFRNKFEFLISLEHVEKINVYIDTDGLEQIINNFQNKLNEVFRQMYSNSEYELHENKMKELVEEPVKKNNKIIKDYTKYMTIADLYYKKEYLRFKYLFLNYDDIGSISVNDIKKNTINIDVAQFFEKKLEYISEVSDDLSSYNKLLLNYDLINDIIKSVNFQKYIFQYLLYVSFDINFIKNTELYKKYKIFNSETFKSNVTQLLINDLTNSDANKEISKEELVKKYTSINNEFNYSFINFYLMKACNECYYLPNMKNDIDVTENNETIINFDLYSRVIENAYKILDLSNIYFNFENLDLKFKNSYKHYNITLLIRSFNPTLLKNIKKYMIKEIKIAKTILEKDHDKLDIVDYKLIHDILNDNIEFEAKS
jgi:hypothetical protein